jgi:membrane-associated phospholipid phosphatase
MAKCLSFQPEKARIEVEVLWNFALSFRANGNAIVLFFIQRTMNSRRHLKLESLEDRRVFAADWQNLDLACDVDRDQLVGPFDALMLINSINKDGIRNLPQREPNSALPFFDVDADNTIGPFDVLAVINTINRATSKLDLTSSLVSGVDPDGNGVISAQTPRVAGKTSPGSKIDIKVWLDSSNQFSSVSASANDKGEFDVQLSIPGGLSRVQFSIRDEIGRTVERFADIRQGDIFSQWNTTLQNIVRRIGGGTTWTIDETVTTKPPGFSRNLAMIYSAMYDAINAVQGTGNGIFVSPAKQTQANALIAATTAAHRVASTMYADAQSTNELNSTLQETLAGIPVNTTFESSRDLGLAVANAIIAQRSNDGAFQHGTYSEPQAAGKWQPIPGEELVVPHWGSVRPFAIDSVAALRSPAPPALTSQEYAQAVDQVLRLGSKTSTERTADQTNIAVYWADGKGSGTPPGHWNQIAVDIMNTRPNMSMLERAKTMALLNIAMADAGIVSWDTKYEFDFWRPDKAIQGAATDGNPQTNADPNWQSLIRTPNFPAYTSGHSTFSGAASTVLAALLGQTSFQSAKDAVGRWSPTTTDPRTTDRAFASFTAAAEEAGMSRIYGGIHFSFDNTAGLSAGRAVANQVLAKLNA